MYAPHPTFWDPRLLLHASYKVRAIYWPLFVMKKNWSNRKYSKSQDRRASPDLLHNLYMQRLTAYMYIHYTHIFTDWFTGWVLFIFFHLFISNQASQRAIKTCKLTKITVKFKTYFSLSALHIFSSKAATIFSDLFSCPSSACCASKFYRIKHDHVAAG